MASHMLRCHVAANKHAYGKSQINTAHMQMIRPYVRAAAVEQDVGTESAGVGVKLPATHVSASQNALKQIEISNGKGINSTLRCQ